jgi:hypothetical protein
MTWDNNTENEDPLQSYSARRKLNVDVPSFIQTISTVNTLVTNPDTIKFNSLEVSLSFVSGEKPTASLVYNLSIEKTFLTGNFSYTPNTTSTGRRLLQLDSLKKMLMDKLTSLAIGYVKKKYPEIAPFLPRTPCAATGGNRGDDDASV